MQNTATKAEVIHWLRAALSAAGVKDHEIAEDHDEQTTMFLICQREPWAVDVCEEPTAQGSEWYAYGTVVDGAVCCGELRDADALHEEALSAPVLAEMVARHIFVKKLEAAQEYAGYEEAA